MKTLFLRIETLWQPAARWLACLAPVADLLARFYIARVFLLSGWSKASDWETTRYLFAEEYRVPLLPPDLAAVIATGGELLLPVLLALGLATQFSAVGLFVINVMAVVSYWHVIGDSPVAIQDHLVWGLLLGLLMTRKADNFSIDALLRRNQ